MRQDVLDKALDDPRGTAARILDAAEEVFAETGYAAASTREMARRARVPFGAVHYHWGSKRQLWEAVFARLSDRTRNTLLRTVRVGATRGATIDGVVDAFFDYLVASPNVLRLAYRACLESGEAHVDALVRITRQAGELGLQLVRELLPDAKLDAGAAILFISNGFVAALADGYAQEHLLGGRVTESKRARERLRAELRRVARLVFQISE